MYVCVVVAVVVVKPPVPTTYTDQPIPHMDWFFTLPQLKVAYIFSILASSVNDHLPKWTTRIRCRELSIYIGYIYIYNLWETYPCLNRWELTPNPDFSGAELGELCTVLHSRFGQMLHQFVILLPVHSVVMRKKCVRCFLCRLAFGDHLAYPADHSVYNSP